MLKLGRYSAFWLILVFSCSIDDQSFSPLNEAGPVIEIQSPTGGDSVIVAADRTRVIALFMDDGPLLSQATFTVSNESESTIYDTIISIVGLKDSVSFDIPANIYEQGTVTNLLTITAQDTEGKIGIGTREFVSRALLTDFSSVSLLTTGGSDLSEEMELVADHTWRVNNLDFSAADGFYFIADNSVTYVLENCSSGVATIGDLNSAEACGIEGDFNVVFNSNTGQVIFEEIYDGNWERMFILGSFNGFGANNPQYEMFLVANNVWRIDNIIFPGTGEPDRFKFVANQPTYDIQWGDYPRGDYIAERNADNPNVFEDSGDIYPGFTGSATVLFNDQTLEFNICPTGEDCPLPRPE